MTYKSRVQSPESGVRRAALCLTMLAAAVLAAPGEPNGGKKEQDPADALIVQLSSEDPAQRTHAADALKKLDRSATGKLLAAKKKKPAVASAVDEIVETIWQVPSNLVESTLKDLEQWDPESETQTEEIWKKLAKLRGRALGFLEFLRKNPGPKGDFALKQIEAFKALKQGEALFFGRGRCSSCHAIGPEGAAAKGPNLEGIGKAAEDLAQQRFVVIGRRMSAADYLVESLVDPDAWVIEGYDKGTHPDLREDPFSLKDSEIQALVVFLQALGGKPRPSEIQIPKEE